MRRYLFYILLLIISFSFTSCLDILEKIHFNKDGSGEYSITVSLGEKLKEKIEDGAESAKENTPSELPDKEDLEEDEQRKNLKRTVENLKKLEGIHEVEIIESLFDFGYKYKFENIEALNAALEATAGDYVPVKPDNYFLDKKKKHPIAPKATYIEENQNTIIRHQNAEIAKVFALNRKKGSNAGMMGGLDIAYILQDLTFKTVYEFEGNVKSVSNESAVTDKNSATILCMPFAYTPKDLNQLRLQEAACEQSIQIEVK